MNFKDIQQCIENNIVKLFTTFNKSPAIFLSEADVQCYLYSLLVNDPIIKGFVPILEHQTPVEESKSSLVHADLAVVTKGKNKMFDITIMEPKEAVDFEDWQTLIGIEIKYNRKQPARKEKSNILEDIKKASDNRMGYILWLNWDREIDDGQLVKVQEYIGKYDNVKLYYLDVFSEPLKTNVKELI